MTDTGDWMWEAGKTKGSAPISDGGRRKARMDVSPITKTGNKEKPV